MDYPKELPVDCESKIKAVLRKYFEVNDRGVDNDEYDPNFSAQEAIDEIHEIVGSI